MKRTFFAALALVALSAQAAVVNFQLSPAGTDVAVGLSPSNVVPAVANSTGSGGVLAGIALTEDAKLAVSIGYGSLNGFADLTGPATGWAIHGPAAPGQNAAVVIDLAPYVVLTSEPEKGGKIEGVIQIPTQNLADLVAGSYYITISTAANPAGEIRGQLVVVNLAPTLTCPPAVTVECPSPAGLTAVVSDPEGEALTVVWTVNGAPLQTNAVAASLAPSNVDFNWSLPLGTNTVGIVVTDNATNSVSCSTTVTVVDTIPPVVVSVTPSKDSLWPPNHKLMPISVDAVVTDACGPTTWKIVSVTSDEPVNDKGDGNTAPDWIIKDDHTLKLRAERSGRGDGRVYTITVQATDAAGNLSQTASTTVFVPKSQGQKHKNNGGNLDKNKPGQDKDNGKDKGKGNGNGGKKG